MVEIPRECVGCRLVANERRLPSGFVGSGESAARVPNRSGESVDTPFARLDATRLLRKITYNCNSGRIHKRRRGEPAWPSAEAVIVSRWRKLAGLFVHNAHPRMPRETGSTVHDAEFVSGLKIDTSSKRPGA